MSLTRPFDYRTAGLRQPPQQAKQTTTSCALLHGCHTHVHHSWPAWSVWELLQQRCYCGWLAPPLLDIFSVVCWWSSCAELSKAKACPTCLVSVGEARAPLDTMDAAEGFAMEIEIVPARMEHLRACLSCSLVKTFDQFFETGCESKFFVCSSSAGCLSTTRTRTSPLLCPRTHCGRDVRQ
jgi:hypothetical protein